MFEKMHRKLSLLCTSVTGLILSVLTGICLIFAGQSLIQNNYAFFLGETNTVITHLQDQDTISHQWLNKLQEGKRGMQIFLFDNGTPLYYEQYHGSAQNNALCEAICAEAKTAYGLDLYAHPARTLTMHEEFTFRSPEHGTYYVSAGIIPKNNGFLSFLLLYPLSGQQTQLLLLALLVLAADIGGILLLAAFFWHFTRRLLHPAVESQKKQALFISAASHELRSPLTVLRTGLEAAAKTKDMRQQAHFFQIMSDECSRMDKLVGDMLLLANADSKSLPFSLEACQPDGILLNVYEKFEPAARQKNIRLGISLPEEVTGDCRCDSGRMEQALSILMDNALSYTPSGGKISLTLTTQAKGFCFGVTDNGPGIPDEEKSLVFERFYRADQSHTEKGHFGLGLCIARELVRRQNGSIRLADAPGGGCSFSVWMPAG